MITTSAGPDPRRIFLLRCLYFLGGLTGATWGRFSTIYFNKVLHFSPSQIGLIEAVMPATRLFFTPLWGVIADSFNAKKTVYLLTSFIASSILLLQAFPAIATGFVPVLLINTGLSAFVASGVLDAHCLEYLAEFGQTRKYGTIRLWTAVSWGVGNVIMGYVTDHYAFWLNFLLFGTMSFIQLVSIYCIIPSDTLSQKRTKIKTKDDGTGSDNDTLEDPLLLRESIPRTSIQQTESFFEENKVEEEMVEEEEEIEEDKAPSSELFRMLCAPSFLFFLFEVSVIGAAVGVVERLLFVYLQSDLGASTFLCGLTVLTTVIFELPIFMYTDYLLKNLGHDGMFIVAMLCYCVRAFGYTLLTKETVWWVIPLEALHGPTFALMWSAAVEFSKSRSPKGWNATVQSILMSSWRCLGMGVGCGVGGWVAEKYGFVFLYHVAGFFVGSVCGVHIIMLMCRKCFVSEVCKNNVPKVHVQHVPFQEDQRSEIQ